MIEDNGASEDRPGSREPSQQVVSALPGFDPSRSGRFAPFGVERLTVPGDPFRSRVNRDRYLRCLITTCEQSLARYRTAPDTFAKEIRGLENELAAYHETQRREAYAQAIEARRAETAKTGSVEDESAVA